MREPTKYKARNDIEQIYHKFRDDKRIIQNVHEFTYGANPKLQNIVPFKGYDVDLAIDDLKMRVIDMRRILEIGRLVAHDDILEDEKYYMYRFHDQFVKFAIAYKRFCMAYEEYEHHYEPLVREIARKAMVELRKDYKDLIEASKETCFDFLSAMCSVYAKAHPDKPEDNPSMFTCTETLEGLPPPEEKEEGESFPHTPIESKKKKK